MDLETRVTELENKLKKYESSFSIPLEIERAFKARLKGLYASSNTTGTYSAVRRTITLSGNSEDISVLEDPAGYIPVEFQGTTYKVPYFTD